MTNHQAWLQFLSHPNSLNYAGTLGWTTGLATGLLAAQTVAEYLLEDSDCSDAADKKQYYRFANGIEIERKRLAPTRFVD